MAAVAEPPSIVLYSVIVHQLNGACRGLPIVRITASGRPEHLVPTAPSPRGIRKGEDRLRLDCDGLRLAVPSSSTTTSSAFDSSDEEDQGMGEGERQPLRGKAEQRRSGKEEKEAVASIPSAGETEESAYDTSNEEAPRSIDCGRNTSGRGCGRAGSASGEGALHGAAGFGGRGSSGTVRCCCVMADDHVEGHAATARHLPAAADPGSTTGISGGWGAQEAHPWLAIR